MRLSQRSQNLRDAPRFAAVRLFTVLACLTASILFLAPADAQGTSPSASPSPPAIYDLHDSRELIAPLDAQWRFHTGDDPDGRLGWSSPAFDDSSWPLVASDDPWGPPGHRDPSQSAWYRAKIRIPAGSPPLSLSVTWIIDSYEIFADGHQIGSFAAMPPHPHANFFQLRQLFPLPQADSTDSPGTRTVTLAIRIWRWPRWAALNQDGIGGTLYVGDSELLQKRLDTATRSDAWEVVDLILLIAIEGLAAFASLAFFLLRRREREYLWFGLSFASLVALDCLEVYAQFHQLSYRQMNASTDLLNFCGNLAQIAFYFTLLRGRRNWLFWITIVGVVLAFCSGMVLTFELGDFTTLIQINFFLGLPQAIWILTLLFQRTRQGMPDARLLLLPVLLQQVVGTLSSIFDLATILGVDGMPPAWFAAPSKWPFKFTVTDAADALFLMAMLAIFIYRFTRTSRREDENRREREAARTIQQVLVPEDLPPTPGFLLNSVYHPYGDVGGDFFQIVPIPNQGLILAIGDVSGKGLPAAMLVSLLVGTLRAIVETTTSPAQLLATLNRLVLGRSNGGFTTCLILRADADGTLTMANAGHIAPYLDGQELPTENGFPLGIVGAASYMESVFHLEPGSQLTLLTDGVVEAQNANRELFGFDRTASVSSQSAEQIADAAESFGQDDDITVLTLTRV